MAPTETSAAPRDGARQQSSTARAWSVLREAPALDPRTSQDGLLVRIEALADLGLRTHAIEVSEWLGQDRIAPSLSAEIRDLPDDRVDRTELIRACERVQRWLVERAAFAQVDAAELDQILPGEIFRAADGSRVWRDASDGIGGLRGAGDAAAEVGEIVPPEAEKLHPPPVLLIGVDPPLMLERAFEACRPRSLGYAPRLFVFEPSAAAAVIGLADLALRRGDEWARALVEADRVSWFIGPDAVSALDRWFGDHPDRVLPAQVFLTPGSGAAHGFKVVVTTIERAQSEQKRLLQRLLAPHAPDLAAAVKERWLAGAPLRIVILATRYANYVGHAAADLAAELRALGHEASVAIEPDQTTTSTAITYARLIRDLQPDLVVLINHFRQQGAGSIPQYIPVVNWSQDAMLHNHAPNQGIRAGPLDFVVGFVYPEMKARMGFEPGQTLPWLNVPSALTFHTGPVSARDRDRLECEIAMATRHSQIPDEFVATFIDSAGAGTPLARAAEAIARETPALCAVSGVPGRDLFRELQEVTSGSLRSALGGEPDRRAFDLVLSTFSSPLADLHFRQETAEWASAVARRRGWRFHLYGRGWEQHPTLGEFARPDLQHGEELRTAYQTARVLLHASIHRHVHQRIVEAAMSGGLPLCRRVFTDVAQLRNEMLYYLYLHAAPDGCVPAGRGLSWTIANHPRAMLTCSALQRLGCPLDWQACGTCTATPRFLEFFALCERERRPRLLGDGHGLADTFVDMSEGTFASEQELEQRVAAALDDRWREARSASVRRRCDRQTMAHLATGMIELVREGVREAGKSRDVSVGGAGVP